MEKNVNHNLKKKKGKTHLMETGNQMLSINCSVLARRPRPRYLENDEIMKRLKEFLRHKDTCKAQREYYIAKCPTCGSTHTRWRNGVGFEDMVICENLHAWEPEYVNGPCTCGLDELKRELGL